MFIKLLKHEIKATSKVFLMMYAIVILLGLMPGAGNFMHSDFIENIGIFAFTIAMTGAGICYIVTIIQRYHNNLYGDEGYLTFTLPVKAWQIIAVKLISATFWAIITGVVAVISIFMLMLIYNTNYIALGDIIKISFEAVKHEIPFIGMLFSILLFTGITIVMRMYMSITVANLPFIQKGKTVISVIFFFFASYVQDSIITAWSRNIEPKHILSYNYTSFSEIIMDPAIQGIYLQYAAISVIFIAIMFFVTNWILSKKLCIS